MAHIALAAVFTQEDLDEQSRRGAISSASDPTLTPIIQLSRSSIEDGYDLICIPLTNEEWKARWKKMCLTDDVSVKQKPDLELLAENWRASEGPFNKSEMNMTRLDEAANVIGMVSEWLELDSPDDGVRYDSEIALKQELAYASYLNLQGAVLPPPRNRQHIADYARAINACLNSTISYLQISIRMPIYDPRSASSSTLNQPVQAENTPLSVYARAPDGDLASTWEMWDIIRSVCGYSQRLSLTLDLSLPLPSSAGVLSRWRSEPVYQIYLPATSFISNAKGYPVLTKATQSFLRETFKQIPTVLLARTRSRIHENGGDLAYAQYIRHLERTSPAVIAAEQPGTLENFAKGYWDYLQAPLQPLMDNLGSGTYETFERDPVKYERYEEAVYLAICDRKQPRTVICVAGAGRGPIVSRCLRALERSKQDGIVYAVEKNPNAFVTLQEHKEREWGDRVYLIYGDMRKIEVPEKIDILVSELLGSFGDNEASPECLDGAMRFLKPDGISIPSSYTAYLAPISSSKLHTEVLTSTSKSGPETPYVVMFQAVNILSGEGGGLRSACGTKIQECWSFAHPRRDAVLDSHELPITNTHNTRSARLTFHIPNAGVLHGLAGYFESVLYRDVGLSIHPESMAQISPNMLSWFPLFFPFRDPLYLPSNSELQVSIWRLTGKSKIWYEWYAESYLPVLSPPPPFGPRTDAKGTQSSQVSHNKSLSTPASSFLTPSAFVVPSPLVSAVPSPTTTAVDNFLDGQDIAAGGIRMGERGPGTGIAIKIGQTALHNPEGRGSWTGL